MTNDRDNPGDRLEKLYKALDAYNNPTKGDGNEPRTPASEWKTAPLADRESPLEPIGPYRLLEPIGEGGIGTVYLAEQRDPINRKVALKIIKAGMDSQEVIARFESERQAK